MIKTEGGKLDVESVQSAYRKAAERTKDWRTEARRCYDYVAGSQWDEEDRQALEDQLRPAVTFNRTAVYVSVVTGLQAIQREEVQFVPRRVGPVDNGASDLWRAAIQYVSQDSDAESHQSHAFTDLVITGMGWTESRMDFTKNPDGDVIAAERVDPLEMYWDWMATQRNLSDARWVMRVVPYSRREVEERWPDKIDSIEWSHDFSPIADPKPGHQPAPQDAYGGQSDWSPDPDDVVYVCHVQWWEPKPLYRVAGPGGTKDVPEKTWRKFEKTYPDSGLQAVKIEKRAYMQAFVCGSTVLEEGPGLCEEEFTLQAMTGHYDRNEGTWHGLVRSMRDPQDWLNKLYSSLLHIFSTNAKGGLIIEETAVSNIRKVEDEWARPDKFTVLRDGAIVKGQIMPKPQAPYPAGMDRMMEVALRMFGDVSGVNPELLGMAQQEQAGVLEYQRKQAAMTTLAWAFDAMRGYLRRWGRIIGYLIQRYLADGRLIRVAGEAGSQYIPLVRDQLALEYDVVVDTAPSSTNEKERTFALLSQLMPSLIQMGAMPPPEVLDYLPLPTSLTEAWKQAVAKPNPMAQQAQQLELAGKQAEVEKTKAEAMATIESAKVDQIKPLLEAQKLQAQQQADERKAMLEAMRLQGEAAAQRHEQMMMALQFQLEQLKAGAEMRKVSDSSDADQAKVAMDVHRQMLEHRIAIERMVLEQMGDREEKQRDARLSAAKEIMSTMKEAIKALEAPAPAQKGRGDKSAPATAVAKVDTGPIADAIRQGMQVMTALIEGLKGDVGEVRERMDEPQDIERDEIGQIVRVGRKRVLRDADGLVSGLQRFQ